MNRIIACLAALVFLLASVSVNALEVAFVRNDLNKIQIWRDGTVSTPSGQKGVNQNLAWSPDGKTIAFTSDRNNGVSEIYFMDADGTNQRTLPWLNALAAAHFAIVRGYSYKGELLLSYEDGNVRKISFVDLASQKIVREISVDWGFLGPLSPDGTKVIVTTGPADALVVALWVLDTVTGARRQLTDGKSYVGVFAWSPDGTMVSCNARAKKDGPIEIYVMNVDGTGMRRITDSVGDTINHPDSWIDNETLVAWGESLVRNESYIYSISVDGSDVRRLVSSVLAVGYHSPVVRPTGLAVSPHSNALITWGALKSK